MINGFAAEQPDRPGIGFVTLVDPETTEAGEIAAAERLLAPRARSSAHITAPARTSAT